MGIDGIGRLVRSVRSVLGDPPKPSPTKKESPAGRSSPDRFDGTVRSPQPQPSYTPAQADRDAAALYEAMEGGVTGWGTDEDKVFKTLEGKRPEQLEMIRRSYKDHYGHDLEKVVRGELSGADLEHAQALLRGHAAGSDAVAIQAELDGIFGDEEEILRILEKRSPEERHAIAQAYASKHGGPGTLSAEEFLLSKLAGDFNEDELARARSLLGASQARSPEARSAPLEVQALKDGLRRDVAGMGTDEDRIFERLEKATPEQRRQVLQDRPLLRALKDDLSTEDFDRAMGLLEGTPGKADAAKLRAAMEGTFGADEEGVRAVLEGKTPEQLAAIKSEYQRQTGKSLEAEIRDWGGADAEVTLRLLNPPAEGDRKAQAEASAERLHLAMDGAGTDEDAIRGVLEGKSKAEIDDIAAAYRQKYGKDLRAELDDELDGRDEKELLDQAFDLGAVDPNDPNASAERLRRLRELKEHESGFGSRALDGIQTVIKGDGESDLDRLERNLSAADKAIQTGDTERARTLTGYATEDVESLQHSKDALADGAATAAVAVATTAAVVATGGAATPLALAGYAALGAGTRAGTYYAFQGDAAGAQELWRQGAIGTAEGGTAVLPVARGANALTGAAARNTVGGAVKAGAREGALGGAAGGVADAATQRETWENGYWSGLQTVAQRAAIEGALGGVTGGVLSKAPAAAPSDVRPGSAFGPRPGDVIGHGRNGPIRMMGGASPLHGSNDLPHGVPAWVASVLPHGFRPHDVSVQQSKVKTGVLNEALKHPQPNTAYWVDDRYLYVTDSAGRVAFVEGTLQASKSVRSSSQQSAGAVTSNIDTKYVGDRGGHIIGAQFGGPPEAINYVPQTVRQNNNPPRTQYTPPDGIRNWYEFEMMVRKHLDAGDTVRVRVTPQYLGASSVRPEEMKVEATLTTPTGPVNGEWRFPN